MEDTKRIDWTWGLKLVINAMNISICHATNQLPYVLVFEIKPRGNYSLISEFWVQGIRDIKDIPKEIIEEAKNNPIIEVAAYLFDLFTMFGSPSILQCNNGKEFTAVIITHLISLWPNTKIINGSPRILKHKVL